jgi:uncharacterized protein YfaS (alpha-2-macroglobulin family)
MNFKISGKLTVLFFILYLFFTSFGFAYNSNGSVLKKNDIGAYIEKNYNNSCRLVLEFPEYVSDRNVKKYIEVPSVKKVSVYKSSNKIFIEGDFKLHKHGGYNVIIKKGLKIYSYGPLKQKIKLHVIAELKSLTPEMIQTLPFSTNKNELGFEFIFPSRITTSNIRKYIKIFPDIDFAFNSDWDSLKFFGNFIPEKDYVIQIKKGFSTSAYEVKKDMALSVRTSDYKPNVKFKNNKRYVSSETEAVIAEAVNVKELKVEIVKINENNLNYVSIFSPKYLYDKWYIKRLEKFGKKVTNFNVAIPYKKNKIFEIPIDLKNNLKNSPDGIYLIKVKSEKGKIDRKVIFKSDIGIVSKISENQMFFMLRSLSKNKPLINASVKVYDKTNELIFTAYSNNDGIIIKDFANIADKKPAVAIVKWEDGINFIRFADSVSSYNILKSYNSVETSPYDALMFFERSLIRPGDSVNLFISVKDKNFNALSNKDITLKIYDPLKKLLMKKQMHLNKNGNAEFKFDTYSSYKTGSYDIKVFLGDTRIGSHELLVETFLPEKIKVSVKTDKQNYKAEDNIKVKIKSEYLFGSPASKLKCETQLVITEENKKFDKYKDFSFFNTSKDKDNLYVESYKNAILNEQGSAQLTFPISIKDTVSPMLKATLLATVFDDGRAVRKYTTASIYPFSEIVGIKLINKGVIETGNTVKFETVVINPETLKKAKSSKKVKVSVYKEYWHYYAGYELREMTTFAVDTNKTIEFVPRESGSYKIVIKNYNGQEAAISFYVSGWDFSPFNLKDKSAYKIKINTDKEKYKKGEQILFDLKSPISGNLLITIEDEKIKKYFLFDMKNNSFSGKIRLPNNLNKGFYLKALVVRSAETGNKVLPFRAIGKKYIYIDNACHKANVEIETDNIVKSMDKVNIVVKTNAGKNADVVVSMVDLGILNIINEGPVKAFEYFMKKLQDKISLYDIYSDLLSIYRLKTNTFAGGDIMAASRMKKHSAPKSINKRVKPFSFWSGIIKTDKNGIAKCTVNIPSYNGKVLVQAVVVNKNKVGSNYKKVTVKDDFIVKPTLPRFLIEKDEFKIPVRIFNNTKKNETLNLFYETTKNLSIKSSLNIFKIKSESSKLIDIDLKALSAGDAKIIFKIIDSKNKEYISKTDILILPSYDLKSAVKSGVVTKEKKKIAFDIKLPEKSKAHIFISDSPYVTLQKSLKYLIGYPYGCVEQTSSKILAMLYADVMLDSNDNESKAILAKRDNNIRAGIAKIISMQNYKGFFTYWHGGYYINHYASTFALFVLKKAVEAGYDVPDFVIKNALKADKYFYNSKSGKYPYFYLAVNDDIKLANKLYDSGKYGNKLSNMVILASVMKQHGNTDAYENLIKKAKEFLKSGNFAEKRSFGGDFYSRLKDLALSLYIYLEKINDFEKDDFANDLYLTINRYVGENKLYSTQDRAFALLALNSFYGKNINVKGNVDAVLLADGNRFNIKENFYKLLEIKNANFEIQNSGKAISYSIDIDIPTILPVNKNKKDSIITVSRAFYDKNGKIIKSLDKLKTGDKIVMKVSALSKDNIKNVVINARIPSCFEIMNPKLYKVNLRKFRNKNIRNFYADYRDDRALLFTDLTAGKQFEFHIPLIIGFKGEFTMPAIYIEAMYDSRINNYFKETKKIKININ